MNRMASHTVRNEECTVLSEKQGPEGGDSPAATVQKTLGKDGEMHQMPALVGQRGALLIVLCIFYAVMVFFC